MSEKEFTALHRHLPFLPPLLSQADVGPGTVTTDLVMGRRGSQGETHREDNLFGCLFNFLPGLLPPELGAFIDSQGGELCGCLPQQDYVLDHF